MSEDGGPPHSLLDALQRAGFTDYEARAYTALLRKSPQTGYELAKLSKVPRSNIYDVLRKLVDRGAATSRTSADGIGYLAVRPDTVLARMREAFEATAVEIERQAQALAQIADHCYVEQFEGRENLLGFVRDAVRNAQHTLTLATCPQEVAALCDALVAAEARGLSCRLICLYGCGEPCAGCQGIRAEYERDPDGHHVRVRPLCLVTDEGYLVTAEIDGESAAGVRTRLPALVGLATRYVRQTWRLAEHAKKAQP